MADEVFTWIDPDGVQTVLNDQTVLEVGWDIQGRYMPPVEFVEDDVPAQDGSRLRQVRVRPRDIALPIDVLVADTSALRVLMRTLMRTFHPQRGDGRLRVTSADGTTRELTCRYRQGLELQERFEAGHGVQRTVVVFRAVDPFWYDTAPMSSTFTSGAAPTFLGNPFLPIKLSSDTILGEQTVTNDGDVDAWPVWTIAGPATSITLTNVTTGEVLTLPVTLTAAQSVVIDTRPFKKTVRRDDGTNLYGNLSAGSALWSLGQGATIINTQVAGSTAATFVTLVFSRRWLSP